MRIDPIRLAVLFVAALTVVAAQAEPWQQPGTTAGEEIIGPDGAPMVWVPAGEFIMGSTAEGDMFEKPEHRVRLSGFWLQKLEVTNALYRAFCGASGHAFPPDSTQPDDHPVCWVNWPDCAAYAEHYGLVLPTEAQWEYAFRGPTGLMYPWGSSLDNDANCCWWFHRMKGPGQNTYAVGGHGTDESWCGAYDLCGNVSEWCDDVYEGDYYANSPTQDPAGPPLPTGSATPGRVIRGGSWKTANGDALRGFNRTFCRQTVAQRDGGFRCVAVPR